ncbi:proline-rich protein 29 [Spea bombifrons]|uniref:proline-rich protein 29 n=1 Tax=Spea bombifrons TaxID=233779 RepID=UPI00234B6870|nr:proline-rich protein 29 [Spea bombifrons]
MSQGWDADNTWNNDPSWQNNYSGVQIIPSMVPQQPTIIQQIPAEAIHPPSYPIRHGRAKEDLIELMMIQNAQMHQVIMSNMTMSAMSSFGYGPTQPSPAPQQPSIIPIALEEEEPVVYHHHYDTYPTNYPSYPVYPAWRPQGPIQAREPTVRHIEMPPSSPLHAGDQRAVPPPPPLSATGTVGADVPPASEYYDLADARL